MKWVKATDKRPVSGVDVHVIMKGGDRSVARYWHETKQWLTADPNVSVGDEIIKWRYADAILEKQRQI